MRHICKQSEEIKNKNRRGGIRPIFDYVASGIFMPPLQGVVMIWDENARFRISADLFHFELNLQLLRVYNYDCTGADVICSV